MISIAIVGAGIAGVIIAEKLSPFAKITLFEKSRGFGGRVATRRVKHLHFDHGAQFFTARTTAFANYLRPLLETGLVQEWQPKIVTLERGKKPFKRKWFEPHYVAVPTMPSLARYAARDVSTLLNTKVSQLSYSAGKWTITDTAQNNWQPFDWVVLAIPPNQARELLQDSTSLVAELDRPKLSACYALLLGFQEHQSLNFEAAIVRDSPLSLIANNATKPGRDSVFSIVLHSDNYWADSQLETAEAEVRKVLLDELAELTDLDLTKLDYCALHRWRYARVEQALNESFLLDEEKHIATCGDWCLGNRVEDAFTSGWGLATRLKELIAD